jgi:nicotinamide mononucleotide (NMN) deamidase PncC
MTYLLEHEVFPYLRQHLNLHAIIKARILRTAAMGESRIDTALSDLLKISNPTVGLSAHPGQTDVRITAKAESEKEADQLIAPVEAEIRRRLGTAIYGTGTETVEEVLLRQLSAAGLALAVAEAGTGGLLTNRLSTAPGVEEIFRGGFVANDPSALGARLGITSAHTSRDELESLARRLATHLKTSPNDDAAGYCLGLVVLTFPRTSWDEATSAGGTVIALGTRDDVELLRLGYGGHADYVATWAITNALELTRRWLQKRNPGF